MILALGAGVAQADEERKRLQGGSFGRFAPEGSTMGPMIN